MRRSYPVVVALLSFVLSAAALETTPPTPDRINGPIVASARAVTNRVHPLATPKADLGRVAPTQVFHRMVLGLSGNDTQKAALTQLLADQQDPKSSSFHKWLTPTEFGERFGPSKNDVATVVNWLTAQGFQVEPPSNGRRFLLFTGTSRQVEAAFQTEMHRYSIAGNTYIANGKPASFPSAMAGVVKGMASLTSIAHPKPQITVVKKPQALNFGGNYVFLEPGDVSTIYNATPLKTANILGQGQSIAVIEQSNINPLDFSDFRTLTGLSAGTLNVIVNGPDPGLIGDETEAIADATWAGAVAPSAAINFVVSASTEFNAGIDLSLMYAVDFAVSPITSLSYGDCETESNLFSDGSSLYGALYEQGAAQGISHFVSSGDNGGDNCERSFPDAGYGVNGLGASPYNVSVGGTDFIDPNVLTYFPAPSYAATGYIPERAWNDYPEFGVPEAGSGGVSINYAKPYWQTGSGVPSDGARDTPDVSLVAGNHEPYLLCERDLGADCSQKIVTAVVGTSLSSPTWAGIQALVNQKNAVVGGSGNPNPTYYRLAAAANSPFHDITLGDNKIPDVNGVLVGYATTPGFDLATGLGTVDINALATGWSVPTGSGSDAVTLTTTATHITHGSPLTANVTVAPSAGTAVPTGDVALFAGAQGAIQITLDGTGASTYAFGTGPGPNQLPGGTYNLTARYAGDAHFAVAVSNPVAITVDAEPSTTLIGSSVSTSVPYGTLVSLAAATYGNISDFSAAGGTYTFHNGSATLGTAKAPIVGESFAPSSPIQASLTLSGTSALPAGNYSVTASFPGDASFLNSTSTPTAITIVPGPTLSSLLVNHTAPAPNTAVLFTANTQSFFGYLVPITGHITFFDGLTPLGSVNLPAAYDPAGELVVTFPYTFASAGNHTVIAQYSGDANNSASVSGIVNITVGGKSSSTTTISAPFASFAGIATTLSAHVTGDSAGTVPTGTVTFTDVAPTSPVTVATATLVNGTASASVTTLASGNHLITASYAGDANYTGSTSTSNQIETGDFTLTPTSSTATVVAGQISSGITLTYAAPSFLPVFSGVTFTCAGLPTGAVCNFSTNPLVPSFSSTGAGGSTTLTIATSGPTLTKALLDRRAVFARRGKLAAMAGMLLLGLPFAWRRRRLASLLCIVVLAGVAAISGCSGGSGSSGYIASGGTPAGTDTVTVTASLNGGPAYGTLTHTATVNLTVTAAAQ